MPQNTRPQKRRFKRFFTGGHATPPVCSFQGLLNACKRVFARIATLTASANRIYKVLPWQKA